MRPDRPKVRIKPKRFAEPEKALLRANRQTRIRPLRPADRAKKYGIGGPTRIERSLRQRIALVVDSTTADQALFEYEFMAESARNLTKHPDRRVCDLGPDAVSGKNCDLFRAHSKRAVS